MSTFNETFNGFAKRIFKALGFTDDIIASKFQSFIDGFSREDKYKLITETGKYVESLELVDNELKGLTTGSLAQYMDQIKDNWDSMNEQLAQLQILSLIQRKEDCSGVIKELLNILGRKIETVNGILKQNLGISSEKKDSALTSTEVSSTESKKKYLKYKNKYLALKKLI